ncbi:Adaptor protein complex AP-3 delta subunit [Suhomyces tanzawaensis NRRL Y-17324]|uniref:AP-3 complex subunit delta n=1 Tax=Suhomyces tanzawaensis NRRL Y-17324 TaxID=984487 RepID=A0A1E4SFZ9_9ASCO|nr:Adaptor protein complex AP-3 delta subunit [Suhomyces tanzawaensis NRRL Y-17324]ODV78438.1 Adaptor protein complex AP-3 delta subunit [Suhomyces tanzawaensis NRRL Y-17324]
MSFQLQNSEVLARLKPFGISFEKSLSDLIKGIRSTSKDSPESLSAYLNSVILECKNELQTTDIETKASAILKLTYLEMYGFDMSWSNFQILEVMSSNKFQQKRIGYLAAIQSFKNEQDLLILATNQFKKDLNSTNHIEIGLALSGIATIVTPNLSKDINDDVVIKLSHSSPYIRKKAILAMFKIFLQYPESLKMNFDKVIDKLDDPDLAVVSATINVICEISKKQPKIFINYLPKFFAILQDSKNNWLIIRILKLFQSLSKVEPRIKKKIIPIILDLMTKTKASSLIYECINCISNGSMLDPGSSKDKDTAKFCISKLMEFFKTNDSNLKFVGLIALINLVKIFPTFIKSINGVSAVIMDCLNDNDLIIKRKALGICHFLVDENNLVEVVKVLLVQLIPAENYSLSETLQEEIVSKILEISNQNNYDLIPNFKWYIAVLRDVMNLTLLGNSNRIISGSILPVADYSTSGSSKISTQIGQEFKNLATKVPSVRSSVINSFIFTYIQDIRILENCSPLLKDFYWILGEYIDEIKVDGYEEDVEEDDESIEHVNVDDSQLSLGKKIEILNTIVNVKVDQALGLANGRFLISKKLLTLDNPEVLIVLVQALVKVLNSIFSDLIKFYSLDGKTLDAEHFNQLTYYLYKVIEFLGALENHTNYEVQERSLSWLEFLKLLLEALTNGDLEQVVKLRNEEVEYYKSLAAKERTRVRDVLESEEELEELEEDDEEDEDEEEDEYEDLDSSDEEEAQEEDHAEKSEVDRPLISLEADLELKANPFSEDIKESLLESNGVENKALDSLNKELPILLTHILPSFFKSYQLNPIEKNAQRKIAIPANLDLVTQINTPPAQDASDSEDFEDDYDLFLSDQETNVDKTLSSVHTSDGEEDYKKKQERLDRLRDDPYYITSGKESAKKSKLKSKKPLLLNESSPEVGSEKTSISSLNPEIKEKKTKAKKLRKEKVVILSEEILDGIADEPEQVEAQTISKKKKNAFKIDSSNLDNFDISASVAPEETGAGKEFEYEIDLDELRKKLADSSIEKKPKKSKKEKSKKEGSSKKEKSKSKTTKNLGAPGTTIVAVKKPKKTKKKKAVIIE